MGLAGVSHENSDAARLIGVGRGKKGGNDVKVRGVRVEREKKNELGGSGEV